MKKNAINKTSMKINESYIGETIEAKVRRIMSNKEPIKDGAPLVYTDRKEGVRPDMNIRTDRWDVAIEAMDAASKSHVAKREAKNDIGKEAKQNMEKEKNSETGSTPATGTEGQ